MLCVLASVQNCANHCASVGLHGSPCIFDATDLVPNIGPHDAVGCVILVVVVVGVGVRACMRVYVGERERERFLLPFVFVLMPKEYADAQRMGS